MRSGAGPRACPQHSLCPLRRQRNEEAAVVVVGGKEVGSHLLPAARARLQLERLVQAADAPFERELRRVLRLLEAAEAEALDDVDADQVALVPAGQLEDAA